MSSSANSSPIRQVRIDSPIATPAKLLRGEARFSENPRYTQAGLECYIASLLRSVRPRMACIAWRIA
jgi:hypothetical protein